jgi:FkbM family methyltransferase
VLKRRLPAQFGGGLLFVSPESGLKYYRSDLNSADPTLFRMAQELVKPADVVWDIGANVGLFTFAAAAISGPGGRVFAVEPDTWLVDLLHRSSRLPVSERASVVVIPLAISDRIELTQLHIAARGRSANFIEGGGSSRTGGTRCTEFVISVTLDWLLGMLPAPQVLKIDVERLEGRLLKGASRMLTEVRPRLWCEVSRECETAVTEILQAADYEIYDASVHCSSRKPLRRAVWETLAVPK